MDCNWDEIFKDITIASSHRKRDTIIKEEEDLYQITTPSEKASWANGVIYSDFDGVEKRQRVIDIINEYRDLEVSFKWLVGPTHKTETLSKVLKEMGLSYDFDLYGMVRSTLPLTGHINPEITVEQITPERAYVYVATTLEGWDLPTEYREPMCRNVKNQIENGKEDYFVAFFKGEPVGSGITTMMGKYGYLKRGSVISQYRGKGIFKALVSKRLSVLLEREISTVLVLAKSDTSAPICERFGFQTTSRIQYFSEKQKEKTGNS